MTARIIDGTALARSLRQGIAARVDRLRQAGTAPGLAAGPKKPRRMSSLVLTPGVMVPLPPSCSPHYGFSGLSCEILNLSCCA